MRQLIGYLALVLAFCGPGSEAVAGERAVRVDDRVRVSAPSLTSRLASTMSQGKRISPFVTERVLVGRVEAIDGAFLRIRVEPADTSLSVAMREVDQLEVWAPDTHKGAGTLFGLLGGAVLGGVIGHSFERDDTPPERDPSPDCTFICTGDLHMDLNLGPPPTFVGILVGGVVGAAVGRLIGSTIPRDRWDPVDPKPLQARFTADPEGRLGVAFRVPF
jgi:hypothetical protein